MAIDSSPRGRTDQKFPPPALPERDSLAVSLRALSAVLFLGLLAAVVLIVAFYERDQLVHPSPQTLLLGAVVVLLFVLPMAFLYLSLRQRIRAVERLAELTRLMGGGELCRL